MKQKMIIWLILLFFLSACQLYSKKEKQIDSVLFLGNSIVAHDPSPEIGWNADWGMAASVRDSDYVHLLQEIIHKINPSIRVSWDNIAKFEVDYNHFDLNQLEYGKNDLIVIKISENVKYEEGMDQKFMDSYDRLIRHVNPSDSSLIVIVEGFWTTPVNDIIKRYAEERKYPFIPLADLLREDSTNAAIGLFEHEGVAQHPSDKGMRNIASRIWNVISENIKK